MGDFLQGKYLLLRHKKLSFVAVQGNLPVRLQETPDLIRKKFPDIEIAPVRAQDRYLRYFLATFMQNPPRDITLSSTGSDCGIVGYGFKDKILLKTMESIASSIHFTPRDMKASVRTDWELGFEIEKGGYDQCEEPSRVTKIPIDIFLGAARYGHFLFAYKGLDKRVSMDIAAKRYSIPIAHDR